MGSDILGYSPFCEGGRYGILFHNSFMKFRRQHSATNGAAWLYQEIPRKHWNKSHLQAFWARIPSLPTRGRLQSNWPVCVFCKVEHIFLYWICNKLKSWKCTRRIPKPRPIKMQTKLLLSDNFYFQFLYSGGIAQQTRRRIVHNEGWVIKTTQ